MREINLKVNNDGTLDTKTILPLHLGTKGDKACVKLKLEIDNGIEGTYRYIKFYNPKRTVLQRIEDKEMILSLNVSSLAGKWLMSFISSDKGVSYSSADGDYIFSTVPVEVEISEGLLDINIIDENLRRIEELEVVVADDEHREKGLFEMNTDSLEIPDFVDEVGNYFLYNNNLSLASLSIGKNVRRIGMYAFYGLEVENIKFKEESKIDVFDSYAFSHAKTGDLVIPKSLTDYGHYAFQGGAIRNLRFEEDSKVTIIGANAFNGVTINELFLPFKMTKFAGNGYVFRACNISSVWIPKSVSTAIPQGAFYKDVTINRIILENGFDISANFSNVTSLTKESIVAMFNALSDRVGKSSLSLTLGNENLGKVTDEEINIARTKNWTIS